MGKKLLVREPTCCKNKNSIPCKKILCDGEIRHRLHKSLANTVFNIEGPENIMVEVEVKLSAMPFRGRNRVLYKEIHFEALCVCILLHILQYLWPNMRHSGNCPQIPENCLSCS